VLLPAAAVWSIAMLRHQALKAELAGLAEQVRSFFTLLKIAQEYAVRPSRQEAG
jgi:hypothetical protein